jgi:hypothetical protein
MVSRTRNSRAQRRSWLGNFTYDSKHYHGPEAHFIGITMLRGFRGMVRFETTTQFFEVTPGLTFSSCRYYPDTRSLLFYHDGPPVECGMCPCCNKIESVAPEELDQPFRVPVAVPRRIPQDAPSQPAVVEAAESVSRPRRAVRSRQVIPREDGSSTAGVQAGTFGVTVLPASMAEA